MKPRHLVIALLAMLFAASAALAQPSPARNAKYVNREFVNQLMIPPLSSDDAIAAFERTVGEHCETKFRVTRVIEGGTMQGQAAGVILGAIFRQHGAYLRQVPEAGSSLACGQRVTVYYAPLVTSPPVTPSQPAGSPATRFRVPSLSSQDIVDRFEGQVARNCRSSFQIGSYSRQSSSPPGTIVGQDPAPMAMIGCGEPVSVYLAAPIRIPVPALTSDFAIASFERTVRGLCRDQFQVDRRPRPFLASEGTILGQNPYAGATMGCGDAAVVFVARPPRFEVPLFSAASDIMGFERRVATACRNGFRVSRLERQSPNEAGSILDQDPRAGSTIGCGDAVSVVIAQPEPVTLPTETTPTQSPTSSAPPSLPSAPASAITAAPPSSTATHSTSAQDVSTQGESTGDATEGGGGSLSLFLSVARPFGGLLAGFMIAALAAAALAWHALLHPRLISSAAVLSATPGLASEGAPLVQISLVSQPTAEAMPPLPLPILQTEVTDV